MITRRKSALRSHVLQLLRQHHLLSTPQLIDFLAKNGHNVNKTSVYRALEVLTEQGQIDKKTIDAETVYELIGHHHDHLICTNCGTIEAVECALALPELPHGYQLEDHTLTLYGRCPNCQKTDNTNSDRLIES